MFCREQIAQLRDITPQIRERGAEPVAIGNGSVAQAKAFAEERDLDFRLLTDPKRATYQAAELHRGVGSTFSLGGLKSAARALGSGHVQGMVQGDAWQQGGAFVIAPGGEVLFEQRSDAAGDHADFDDILAVLG